MKNLILAATVALTALISTAPAYALPACEGGGQRDGTGACYYNSAFKFTEWGANFGLTTNYGHPDLGHDSITMDYHHDRWVDINIHDTDVTGRRRVKREITKTFFADTRNDNTDSLTDGTKTYRITSEFIARAGEGTFLQAKAPNRNRRIRPQHVGTPYWSTIKRNAAGGLVFWNQFATGGYTSHGTGTNGDGGARGDGNNNQQRIVLGKGILVEGGHYKAVVTNRVARDNTGSITVQLIDPNTDTVLDEQTYNGRTFTDVSTTHFDLRTGTYRAGAADGGIGYTKSVRNFSAVFVTNEEALLFGSQTNLTDGTVVTNEGTGIASDNRSSNLNWGGDNEAKDRLLGAFRGLHSEGFRGQGTTVIVGTDLPAYFDALADEANILKIEGFTKAFVSKDGGRVVIGSSLANDVTSDNLGYVTDLTTGFGNSEAKSNAIIAAGTSVLWSKFDALNAAQVEDLIMSTSIDDKFRLDRAMSPAGRLR